MKNKQEKLLNIVSFSGGKDSTALLLMMLERGMKVDYIVCVDMGKEFPEMYEHWKQVEEYTGRAVSDGVRHSRRSSLIGF